MKKETKNMNSGRKEFGNYIIGTVIIIVGKTIGEGTFGKVKSSIHKLTNENVAIKILEKNKINDQADT
jgi:serine/threonine protein kinase